MLNTVSAVVLVSLAVISVAPALAVSSIYGNIGSETYIYLNAVGNDQGNGSTTSLNVTGEYFIDNLPGNRYYVISDGLRKFYLPDGVSLNINQAEPFPSAYNLSYGPTTHKSRRLGQTFIANAEYLQSISTTNATDPAMISCRVYENGPGGALVWDGGTRGSGQLSWWAVWVVNPPRSVKLIPGKRYYVEFHCADRYIMIPYHASNPYRDGETFILREADGQMLPIAYSDLTMTVDFLTPGFSHEYYSHGATTASWVGSVCQTYVAKGVCLRSAHFFLPWDPSQSYTRENFMFTLHEYGGRTNPVGPQIGPAKRGSAGIQYPNGCGVTWDSGECPTVPGRQYLIRVTKTDGGFVAWYKTEASNPGEDFFKNGSFVDNASLIGNVYADDAERLPLNISGVQVQPVGATGALITWQTEVPATSQVEFWTGPHDHTHTVLSETPTTSHSVQLTRLMGSTTYHFRVKSYREGHEYASQEGQFTTPAAGAIVGTVLDSTGQPVVGASVQTSAGPFGSYSAVTGSSGGYLIENVEPGTYDVVASRAGLMTAAVTGLQVLAGVYTPCDMVMQVIGEFVANGGFETGDMSAWTLLNYSTSPPQTPQPPGVHCMPVPFFAEITPRSGDCFLAKATNWWGHNGFVGQRVAVTQGKTYRVSAFYRIYWVGGDANAVRCMLVVDPLGRNDNLGYNLPGVVRSALLSWPTEGTASPWLPVSVQATAQSNYLSVWLTYYQNQGEWRIACYDDVSISRVVGSLASAKTEPEGTRVAIDNVVVTATKAQLGDRAYVQSEDRTCGIQLFLGNDDWALQVGDRVTVEGRLAVKDGETVLENCLITKTGSAPTPKPLGITVANLGGGDFAFDPGPPARGQQGVAGGVGLNNVGLLVRCCGKVAAAGAGYFVLNDGSLPAGSGVTVLLPTGVSAPEPGRMAAVTGVCGTMLRAGQPEAVLLVRTASDVTLLD